MADEKDVRHGMIVDVADISFLTTDGDEGDRVLIIYKCGKLSDTTFPDNERAFNFYRACRDLIERLPKDSKHVVFSE